MAEELKIDPSLDRASAYRLLLPQVAALIENEPSWIANLANTAAAIKSTFDFLWVGFYQVVGDSLVLGPFQGPIACTRIRKGDGVCGQAWAERKTLCVPDVDQFPGHIACSSESRSEIVVPLIYQDRVIAVLDIDSTQLSDFSEIDQAYLEQLVMKLCQQYDDERRA